MECVFHRYNKLLMFIIFHVLQWGVAEKAALISSCTLKMLTGFSLAEFTISPLSSGGAAFFPETLISLARICREWMVVPILIGRTVGQLDVNPSCGGARCLIVPGRDADASCHSPLVPQMPASAQLCPGPTNILEFFLPQQLNSTSTTYTPPYTVRSLGSLP